MLAFLLPLGLFVLARLAFSAWVAPVKSDPGRDRLLRYVFRPRGRRRPLGQILARADRRLVRARAMALLERRLHQAGVPLTISEALLALAAGSALFAASVGAVWGARQAAIATAACPLLAWGALGAARGRRIRRLDRQLPAALDLLVGQLRAHRSIAEALMEMTRQVSDPLRGEMVRVADEIRLGVPLSRALETLRRRIPSRPLSTTVTAILVSDRTGGNLAEFLTRQSKTVRDQVAFLQEVRALTAHARSSAAILSSLPVGVALAMYILTPGFFAPMLASNSGRALLACAVAMEVVGSCVIRGMVRSVER